jgi:ferrous iron transport protein A
LISLAELQPNEIAIVVSILSKDQGFRNRVMGFGLKRGAKVTMEQLTFLKKTLKVRTNTSVIAMRNEEADRIIVKKVS